MLNNIDKEMTLNALSAAINALDKAGDIGNGDTLFELMNALITEWGMEDE